MKTLFIRLTLLLCLLPLFSEGIKAQNEKRLQLEKCVRLEGGVIGGSQLSDRPTSIQPGVSLQYSYCIKSGLHTGIGFGGGLQFLDTKGYIPFYLNFIGIAKSKAHSPFINLQAGYAFSWIIESDEVRNYSGHGPCMGIAFGQRFMLNEKFATYFSLAYNHQMLLDNVKAGLVESARKGYNFNMFVLSIGIMLEQS